MPDWFTSWVARLFGNEPLVKIMYSIIVWAILLAAFPSWIEEKILTKSQIPYLYQVSIFAFSFVIVDLAQRFYKALHGLAGSYIEVLRNEAQQKMNASNYSAMERTIDELNDDERELLSAMVEDGIFDVSLRRGDRLSQSLCEKGILVNTGPSAFDKRQDSLVMSEKFQALLYKKLPPA